MSERAFDTDRAFLWEKFLSLALVSFALFAFSQSTLLILYIVLGQGHFVAAYVYRFKAGKMNRYYLLRYVLVASCLFLAYPKYLDYKVLETITSIYFVVHFLFDERHLAAEEPSTFRALEILPFFLIYCGYIIGLNFNLDYLSILFPIALVICGAYYIYVWIQQFRKRKLLLPLHQSYFLGITVLLFAVHLTEFRFSLTQLMAAIILLHYSNWYINYYFRFTNNPARLRVYVTDMLVINLLVIACYLSFAGKQTMFAPLRVFFEPAYFYIWTLLHLIFSTRKKDFAYWLPFSLRNALNLKG